ncbi:protein SAR DEFICIENT 1-like [Nicotiana tomentosiformis]|uniref:protein SAR DEFICIENT 1-like n=1 Tax=Nicotiana tomentosiformis TaxID=4098 RepID=UPI00051C115E|nr:protein SAR DEFICIENT 1-like [Nicotiana tomentosiformis]
MAAKRFFDDSDTDPNQPNYKRMRTTPSFASVIKEVVMVKFLDNVSSALEPMLRRVVNEEVESGLKRYSCRTITRSPSLRIKALEPSNLRLTFSKKLSAPIFTGSKIVAGDGHNLQILLVDTSGEGMVPTALPYPIKLEIVVLDGDFLSKQNDQTSWTHEEFNKSIVKERTGRRPLIAGELNFTMRDGVVSVGEIEFTDNSSWIRSGRFRLGAKLVQIGTSETTVRITEAITESFRVKDHRGELYKKHYPPALGDEVWRLEKIGKDGTFHKKLSSNRINTVQDFLKLATVDTPKLRTILGSGMSDKIWDATYKHANTCEKGSKLYMASGANYTLFLSPICQVVRAIVDGQICANRDLTGIQRGYIQNLVKEAYANWSSLEEVDGRVNEPALLTQGETVVDQYPNVLYQQPTMLRSYQLNATLPDASEQLVEYNNDWIVSSSYIWPPADNGGF